MSGKRKTIHWLQVLLAVWSCLFPALAQARGILTTDDYSLITRSKGYSFTTNDHLTGDTVDSNGNTITSPIAHLSDHTGTYTDVYDFRNKLIKRSYTGGKIILLSYDADGNRVSKEVLDGSLGIREHHYLVDTNNHTGYAQVVEESDAVGSVTHVNLYGHDLVSTNFLTKGYQRYYQYDGLGSVRALSDENGDVTDEYTYDAFGLLLSSSGSTPNQYRYTGEQWDSDLGMYFLRARYMNVSTGRFHSMDTYQGNRNSPLSLHKYLYANANPVTHVDPSGNFSLAQTAQTIGITIGLATWGGGLIGFYDGLIDGLTGGLNFDQSVSLAIDRAVAGAKAGAVFGALWAIPPLRPAMLLLGVVSGANSSRDAFANGRIGLGTYRAAVTIMVAVMGKGVIRQRPSVSPPRIPIPKDLPSNIHAGGQGKHIPGHKGFIAGRSPISKGVNPQTLLDGVHAGRYPVIRMTPRGQPVINFGRPIGEFGGQPTNYGIIHYGKNGAHIVPANPVQF